MRLLALWVRIATPTNELVVDVSPFIFHHCYALVESLT